MLSRVEIGPLLALFARKPGRGRQPYSRMPIIYAFLASYFLNVRTIQGLVDRLNNDPALRRVCGFTGKIPSRSTFSRTFGVLAFHRMLLHDLLGEVTRRMIELNPDIGTLVAVDSTTIPAWANPNNEHTRDPDAGWTRSWSASATGSGGLVWVYGYKAHVLACVETAIPLAVIFTAANHPDSGTIPPLVELADSSFPPFQPYALMADKGYDSRANSRYLHGRGIAPIIPLVDRRREKPIYTLKGEPKCLGDVPMEFIGTDPTTGCHGFRCPAEGCHRRNEAVRGVSVCDDEVWENPDQDPYILGGKVSRASAEWDRLYEARWEIERYFSLLKDNHWVEDHRCRGLARVELHFVLGMLTYQAMVLDRMLERGVDASWQGLFRAA